MTTKTKAFDAAEYLETEDDIREFLSRAAEDGNTQHLVHCLGVAARAKGMTEVAAKAGVTRASLYKSLEEGANPKLDTISKVLGVFGCKLSITPDDSHRHA
ncbi:addiction module antidote protein [Thalassolituus pacificus]|uniref:Addiction module antidote protein n=1 Tax=Thalassolituus pacificus TaxID=2975440 RepID=A0A9X2WBN0_9GAMM|nr:addiction module antidote protein [Thalassolituus pacificus]MCT7357546.1 putative addiction module antidote protein [Thalassolituus pacificus]